eukprot:scaffold7275_cov61-Phaeocystis_antarctica.AAC.5
MSALSAPRVSRATSTGAEASARSERSRRHLHAEVSPDGVQRLRRQRLAQPRAPQRRELGRVVRHHVGRELRALMHHPVERQACAELVRTCTQLRAAGGGGGGGGGGLGRGGVLRGVRLPVRVRRVHRVEPLALVRRGGGPIAQWRLARRAGQREDEHLPLQRAEVAQLPALEQRPHRRAVLDGTAAIAAVQRHRQPQLLSLPLEQLRGRPDA